MSDERRPPENPTESDDQALGEALGSAIRGRVDTPSARPPVSSIAERAAARAKARNARRTVVGIAASIALVAGGIAAWNALDDDQPTQVIVVDEPPTTSEPAPTADPVDGLPDTPPVTPADSSGPATPESLSTGPVLEWTEFDPASVFGADVTHIGRIHSVGDGRVLALVYGPSGSQVLVSANGVDWAVVPMPPDFDPEHIDITSSRWLVTGLGANRGTFQGPGLLSDDQGPTPASETAPIPSLRHQAFFSDDQGATWTDLGFSLDPAEESARVAAALVSGENMVVAVNSRKHPDVASVIVARGLVPDKESIRGWTSVEGDTVSFTRDESSAPESFELTAEEEALLFGGIREHARLYYSDGGPAQVVAEFPGAATGGYGTDDGFHLALLGYYQDEQLLTSSDGLQWSQAPLLYSDGAPDWGYASWHSSPEQTIWTSGQTGRDYRIELAEGVYAPPFVAELPNGIAAVHRLAVGPAGIATVAIPGGTPELLGASPELRLAQDGYELRYNEPVGGFTLWDLSEDAPVYEFDSEALDGNTPPEGFRPVEDESGGSGYLVFQDPETGDDLVTFNLDDLEAALLESLPQPGDEPTPPPDQPKQPDPWVGWSIDGSAWGWQTISDAFNVADSETEFANVELAVGADFVLARVETFEAEPSDATSDGDGTVSLTGQPPRWFIARIG
ncbi:hypothetical protein [Candidatus Poriferisocius sp.]|uniref:hypothetical protein n=1 Tax=Candidatus Poriferisocius sp. TaxID=3101276 RepID=UPI003B019FB5